MKRASSVASLCTSLSCGGSSMLAWAVTSTSAELLASISRDLPLMTSSRTDHTTSRSSTSIARGALSTLGFCLSASGGVGISSHISSLPMGASDAGDQR